VDGEVACPVAFETDWSLQLRRSEDNYRRGYSYHKRLTRPSVKLATFWEKSSG
jgi:hypothetical protein